MRLIINLAVLLLISPCIYAQSGGDTIFRFLDVIPTARAAALGGNHPGLLNADFSHMNINPAYINEENSGFASATYINYLADANMGITNAAFHLDGIGTMGFTIRYVGYGELTQYDESGTDLGAFRASDISFTGSFSRAISPELRAGAAVDLIHASYLVYRSSAVAFSGGLYYKDAEANFSAGISIRNAGAQLSTFDEIREPLPLDITAGFTKKPEQFPFALSLSFRRLNDWDLRTVGETTKPSLTDNILRHVIIGGEAVLSENLQFRFGYDHWLHEQTETGKELDLAGFAFGIGVNIRSFQLDISRNAYSRIGGMTQISIKTRLW